jgi:protein-disulfide isomerase
MSKLWQTLDRVATAALLAVCLVVFGLVAVGLVRSYQFRRTQLSSGSSPAGTDVSTIPLGSGPLEGSPTARVLLIEYSDFDCLYCRSFATETLPTIRKNYVDSGKVRINFRNFPIEQAHPQAFQLARLGVCAARQGMFWQVHDVLFAAGPDLIRPSDLHLAGLDDKRLSGCMNSQDSANEVRAEIATATQLHLRGTPSFLIGVLNRGGDVRVVNRLSGNHPVADFAKAFAVADQLGLRQ